MESLSDTIMRDTEIRIDRTIKGGYRRAEKSRKMLMMRKAAKLNWGG